MVRSWVPGFILVLELIWASRPPAQTPTQAKVVDRWTSKAAQLSEAARPDIVKELNSTKFRTAISPLSRIAKRSTDELFRMLNYEFYVSPVIHNVPMGKVLEALDRHESLAASTGGSDVDIVIANGFLPTVWELIANGTVAFDDKKSRGLNTCEVDVLGYPNISIPKPSLQQAYDRPVYNALNIWRRSGGNFEYGEIAFVANEVEISNKTFWSPVDTGWYCFGCISSSTSSDNCSAWDHTSFGTHVHWYHLLRPHLRFWGYQLSDLFLRWYGGNNLYPVHNEHLYMESELSGAFLVPEVLKYLCIQFTQFKSKGGNKIQNWARNVLKRPMLWADDYNSKMVVDPFVGMVTGDYVPDDTDRAVFWQLWNQDSVKWSYFLNSLNVRLHLFYMTALNEDACDPKKCYHCRFIGVNTVNECVYWKPS